MNEERAVVLSNWPQPAVVAEAEVRADEHGIVLRYYSADEKTVVVRFPSCHYLIFGSPNDEALGGHPLSGHGLGFYSVHEVQNSSLIRMLERRNSVHPRHDKESYIRDKKHYIFTFQDSTLECVVSDGKWWTPSIATFETRASSNDEWERRRDS